MFSQRYNERLLRRAEAGLLRAPAAITGREGKYVLIGGRKVLNFSSNDYLGLGVSPKVAQKAARNFKNLGTSSSSSRLVSGNYAAISRVEEAYARYFGYEAALFFPSGYQANLGILSALFEKGDTLLFDKHIHGSSIKGIILSGASFQGYNHNSMSHLRRRLEGMGKGQAAVLTESLFSMDGDFLDIEKYADLRKDYGFFSVVDEAHAFGALGRGGRGLARSVADISVGTFGKAFGLFGAFVLMPQAVREYLFNFSSPFIYSTSLPEAHAVTALDILEVIARSDAERLRLSEVSRLMKEALSAAGLEVKGDAHIIVVQVGSERLALTIAESLLERDIYVFPGRYPTVPLGRAILRISMTALHTEKDVKTFVKALKDIKTKQDI